MREGVDQNIPQPSPLRMREVLPLLTDFVMLFLVIPSPISPPPMEDAQQ